MPRSLREQIADACVHFNGTINDRCKAGVCYDDVAAPDVAPLRLPCFRSDSFAIRRAPIDPPPCAARRWLTDAEVDAEVAACDAAINDHLAKIAAGVCPTCGGALEPRQQVGRCIYGACGCRIGQGRIR